MTHEEQRSIARAHFLGAIAYHEDAGTVRYWLRKWILRAPARGPLVIVCAADHAGLAPQDSGGGSSKRPRVTERQVRAALAAHADIIPVELRPRIQILAYDGARHGHTRN